MKDLVGARKELSRSEIKLSNEGFLAKVYDAVVEKEQSKKDEVKARLSAREVQKKELQKLLVTSIWVRAGKACHVLVARSNP